MSVLSCNCAVPLLGLAVTASAGAQLSREEVLAGAQARIEEHRKSDAVVTVVDAGGKPVTDARVHAEQVRHEFLFGSNIFGWEQPNDTDRSLYRDQFAALLNYATLPFYWWGYEAQRGEPNHEQTERVARWCAEHGIETKGHPLVWNYEAPSWLPDDVGEIVRLSDERVRDCVTRFAGLIDRWDVVNEATDPFRFDNLLSKAWRELGQIPFTVRSFEVARQAGPDATLLINDYRHDEAYAEVIEALRDADGRPLYDAIGIQTHMHGGVMQPEYIWAVCERFARFGVPLHFTETTILSGPPAPEGWETTPEGEARQADDVEMFYTVVFSHPATEALTWWDFADRWAWQNAPAGFLRKDLSPKPSYERLMGLIKGKWWTKADGTTDSEGRVVFRGFHGDYSVTVTAGDAAATAQLRLTRGGANRLEVVLP